MTRLHFRVHFSFRMTYEQGTLLLRFAWDGSGSCLLQLLIAPLYSQKYPGLDSKSCGHLKSELSWRRIKLKEVREASWKSAALMYTRENGT